ncbi:MAG TPA: complex I subunit 1 family protein [Polyangiaceae bacterium]|jgi:NADH-quinone oxidoreductase subunit H|nr:complex I subunit 1 family protein [Polyangiaceae bacterium]
MTGIDFLFAFGKAFFVVMFAMNVAVILTWADRRYGALLQDRVGPERAVIWLPRRVAQAMAFLPALAVAGGVLLFAEANKEDVPGRAGNALFLAQGAIFMTWFTGLVIAGAVKARGPRDSFEAFIRSIGDPRVFFYAGLVAHVGVVLVAGLLRGSPVGETFQAVEYRGGAMLLAVAVVAGAGYAAMQMKDDKIGLRLLGLLHPAADGLKTAFKEDFIPPNADRFLHSLAPIISFFPALVVLGTVPFGDTLCFGEATSDVTLGPIALIKSGHIDPRKLFAMVPRDGICPDHAVKLAVVDLNIGLLYFFALAGTGIVGAALAGWSSDNKYSLLGGLRAASQMVSYEVTLGLTMVGAVMTYGTLRIDEMVRWQAENAWGIFVQPLGFILFFAASVAESKRIPFDLPEGESELVAGYYTEYSGMKFAMFFFAEYVAVVTGSALMAAVFLGGWHLPFVARDGIHLAIGGTEIFTQPIGHGLVVVLGVLAFVVKTIMLCMIQLTIRWTLPRFRYDQLMRLGWRKLLPASLANLLVTGLAILTVQSAGPSVAHALAIAGGLTQAFVALLVVFVAVVVVRFLLAPAEHRRSVASTSAKFAAMAGGTRSARMGA